MRQWALLVIASGYACSALIVVAHALAFSGAFSRTRLFDSGLQSAVWLYWFWHLGLPLAISAALPAAVNGAKRGHMVMSATGSVK